MELFRPDKPIDSESEDKFQRYQFAKRIAAITSSGKYGKSMVVGIYGKWGEGKTSVMNLIQKELPPETVVINFNPWFFNDEKQLVKSFFENIAHGLGKKLKNKTERAIDFVSNYADSIGTLADIKQPGLGGVFSFSKKIVERFKKDSIEDLKRRVDDLIIEANTNFVVFIDDIDRLDINEVQSVFKLVKLVGDFPRTSYVLSFDDDMVASALGPRYGNRDKISGYEFLEKIIQVPLYLPKANKQALRSYTLNLVDVVFNNLEIKLTKEEIGGFISKFDEAFLPAITNPRLGVRFSNSIGFSIPLLLKEANIGDLMTIEAIKIFYPELYHFIRNNPSYFLRSYSNSYSSHNTNEDDKRKAINAIDEKINIYGVDLGKHIQDMLMNLFPQLRTLYQNYLYRDETYQQWYRERRICSHSYFERYFSYVVKDGDISDAHFQEIMHGLALITVEELYKRFSLELPKLKPADFLFKVQQFIPTYDNDEALTLAKTLAKSGDYFPTAKELFSSYGKDQAAYVIQKLLEIISEENRLQACLDVLAYANSFEYLMEIQYRFRLKSSSSYEVSFLSDEQNKKISEFIISKIEEDHKLDFFAVLPDYEILRILFMYEEVGKLKEAILLLEKHLNSSQKGLLDILKIFTPTITSSSKPMPYKANFTVESFNNLKKFVDIDNLYNESIKAYGGVEFIEVEDLRHSELTDENLIALFQKMYTVQ